MKLESINSFLNNSGLHTFYPTSLPKLEAGSVVSMAGGTVERGGVYEVYLRIVTYETHPSISDDKAHEIRKYLYENLKGAFFNGKKVLNVITDTPEPLPIGEENGVYSVSWNYTILEG